MFCNLQTERVWAYSQGDILSLTTEISHLSNQTCMCRFSGFITFLNRLFSTIFQDDDDTSDDESETESCTSDEHSVTDDDEVKTMTSWDDVRVGMLFMKCILDAIGKYPIERFENRFFFYVFFFRSFFLNASGFFSVHWLYLCVFIHLPNIPAWRSRNDKYIIRNIIYVFYIVNISFHEQTNVIIYLSFISISCIDYSSIHTSYIGNASFCLPDFLSISRDIIDFLHTIDTTECSLCRMRLLTWNHCFLYIVWLHQTLHSLLLYFFLEEIIDLSNFSTVQNWRNTPVLYNSTHPYRHKQDQDSRSSRRRMKIKAHGRVASIAIGIQYIL